MGLLGISDRTQKRPHEGARFAGAGITWLS